MRITLAGTATLSALALALGCLTAPASAAPTPSPGWTNTQLLGHRESLRGFVEAPDGYALALTADQMPLGCGDFPGACNAEDYQDRLVRTPGGTWSEVPDGTAIPRRVVFDAASNGWGLADGSAAGVAPGLSGRPAGGAWGPAEPVPLTPAPGTFASLLLTDSGEPVVWNTGVVDGQRTLQVAIRTKFGWVSRTRSTDGPASLIAGPNGTVRAAWLRDERQVVVSDLGPDGTWGPETPALRSSYALNEVKWLGGHALLVRFGEYPSVTDGVVTEGANAVWGRSGTFTFTQPGNITAYASGGLRDVVTMTYTDEGRVHVMQQQDDGTWTESVVGRGSVRNIVVDTRGNATLVGTTSGTTSRAYVVQRPVNGTWTTARTLPDAITKPDSDGELLTGVDARGTVTVGALGTVDKVQGAYTQDLHSPVALSVIDRSPADGWATATSFGVGWKTTWLRATSSDVRYRERRITSSRFAQHQLATGTKTSSTKIRGRAGTVYCLSARGHAGTTTGPWGAETCVATPLDDRSLKASKGWTRGAGSTSRTRGATLTSPTIQGTRFALAVHPSARGGVIRVSLGGHRIATLKLTKGNPKKTRIIGLKAFRTTQRGKLVITVASSGKPVRIDGVYAR